MATVAARDRAPLILVLLGMAAVPAAAAVPDHPGVAVGPPGEWVLELPVEVAAAPPAPDRASAALEYLLIDRQAELDGVRTSRYSRYVTRVVTSAGLERAAQQEVSFDPAYSRAVLHQLRVWRDGAWHDRLDEAFVSVIQRESDLSRRLYDGGLTVLMVMSDLQVGDVVDVATTVEGSNPVFGGRYQERLALAWSMPVARRHVRVVGPADAQLEWRTYGTEPQPPEEGRAGSRRWWRWDLRDIPAALRDAGAPPWWDDPPWLELGQFRSWAEVVDWALPLYRDGAVGAGVARLAEEIRGRADTPEGRALAAVRFVQDEVRYFAFALGEGSHAPRPPDETLERRFGDCKDKARLLVALLGRLGIEAAPALVESDGDDPGLRLPSPGAFDHVVVVLAVGGREVWVDPTLDLQGGDLARAWLPPYRRALVVRPGETDLVAVPPECSTPGRAETANHYRFAADGEVEVTVSTVYEGAAAEDERVRLADTTLTELQQGYLDYYQGTAGRLRPIEDIAIEDDRAANRLTIVERYRAEEWWQDGDGGERRFALLRLPLDDVLEPCTDRDRRAPFELPQRVRRGETVTLEMPAGWWVEADEEQVATPWFRLSSDHDGSSTPVRLAWELETGELDVPAERVDEYNEAVERVGELLSLEVVRPGDGNLSAPAVTVWAALAAVALAALWLTVGVGWVLARARWL